MGTRQQRHLPQIHLSDGHFGEEIILKIQRGTTLIFKLSANLHGIRVKLFTNHTKDEFNRNSYHELGFSDNQYDEETSAKLDIQKPGTFHYYFVVTGRDTNPSGGGYFLVDPDLKLSNNESLSLDSISMITYMAKCLGRFKDWEGRLNVAKETWFNFIHFTPVQSLGSSGSGYSLLNQLELNPSFGKVSWEELKLFVNRMQTEWNVFSLCDIVLNHTANESPWLVSHPESAYNLVNCPHLLPAYLLDRFLVEISKEIAEDKWETRGVPSTLNSETHLNSLRVLLKERVTELRLEEFYLANVEDCKVDLPFDGSNIEIIHTYRRYGSKVAGTTPRWKVEELNETTRNIIRSHLDAAVDSVIAGVRYERVEHSGPKYPRVDKDRPLIHRYFEEVSGYSEDVSAENLALNASTAQFIMAHNGWVMNDDPLRNFADADSNVYLRRELIAWGDSIKLRYGDSAESSPFLWSLMREYTELVASVFHGIRLDNCHSTPLHVAEFLIDAARSVRPELLVVAELFTNSDSKDNVFVNRLGINVLIREAQQAWNCNEQGRLLFRYGGKPVGAFENTAPPPIANALLFDQTHDNPSPIEKRSVKDILPTAALVSFGACAVGSNRGYDDIVPHHIHVVDEFRYYTSFTNAASSSKSEIGLERGILTARKCLNLLHYFLGQEGFSETFVDQLDADVVCVTRSNPISRKSMILVAYTAFSIPPSHFKRPAYSIKAVEVEGEVSQVLFEGRLVSNDTKYVRDEEYLTGIDSNLEWSERLDVEKSKHVQINNDVRLSRIQFVDFQPGDIIAFSVIPFKSTSTALQNILHIMESDDISVSISKLDLVSLNHVLYRCKEEEGGIYALPGFGDLVYAGLQGIASILDQVSVNNDLGHPICSNLRDGNWLMEYIVSRLVSNDSTKELGQHIQKLFHNIGELPRYLVPTYFDQAFKKVYALCIEHAWEKMNVINKAQLVKLLALTSVQFVGIAAGGALPAGGSYHNFIEDGKPFVSYSLSAGLPHFSTGYMRSWGRDTFISLPGLLLLTSRFEEAKQHILSYASVIKNGLVPNLLNKGNCRYNCRDATWWWLYSIVKYLELVPNGVNILQEEVTIENRLVKLQDVMHLSIQSHFKGIHFREENAGQGIDAHMKDAGFNIDIDVDIETGLIYGGNALNCGTWMDKMGSSETGGNRGIPATPRDGASVEIIGLSAAVLKKLGETNEYQYKFVENARGVRMSYVDWYSTIKANFDSLFFISNSSSDSLVNSRNLYKDTLRASNKFGDYQLRPNFLIAMVAAPEIFNKEHALQSLNTVKEKLLSPLGIKTLDESDWNYYGDYFNSDSSDYKTAGGFNYHQGPEWLWPVGFYLRARLLFSSVDGVPEVRRVLSKHYEYLQTNPWRSLPELTNRGGKNCPGSCTAQAWSTGTLLEVMNDLGKLSQ